jgi:hypothetical protein
MDNVITVPDWWWKVSRKRSEQKMLRKLRGTGFRCEGHYYRDLDHLLWLQVKEKLKKNKPVTL